jgi:cyanophycin synthetase
VRDIGSRFAGVDILTNDPSVPLAKSRGVFLELNTTPGIHHHYIAPEGGSPPVAVAVLRHIFEQAQMSRGHGPSHELIAEGLTS